MVSESAEAALSISDTGNCVWPLVTNRPLGCVFCFVSMIQCDLAGGITQMQTHMQSWKMSLLKDIDKCRPLDGSFPHIKLPSRQGQDKTSKFKESKAKQLRRWKCIASIKKKGKKKCLKKRSK